jgi:hypothetical protein
MDQDRVKDWRELCKAAANELDPKKLMALIAEITRALDERDKKRKLPSRTTEIARRVFAVPLLFEGDCDDSDYWSKWKRRS